MTKQLWNLIMKIILRSPRLIIITVSTLSITCEKRVINCDFLTINEGKPI